MSRRTLPSLQLSKQRQAHFSLLLWLTQPPSYEFLTSALMCLLRSQREINMRAGYRASLNYHRATWLTDRLISQTSLVLFYLFVCLSCANFWSAGSAADALCAAPMRAASFSFLLSLHSFYLHTGGIHPGTIQLCCSSLFLRRLLVPSSGAVRP